MYAIIKTGGKQYRVEKNSVIYIEKLDAKEGSKVKFDEVLLVNDGKATKIGAPMVDGAVVSGKIEKHGKGKKVVIFKYRAKKDSKSKQGHRQPYTKVVIDTIKA